MNRGDATLVIVGQEAYYVLREEHEWKTGVPDYHYSAVLSITKPGRSRGDYTEILQLALKALSPKQDFSEIDAMFRAYHAALALAESQYEIKTFSVKATPFRPNIEISYRMSEYSGLDTMVDGAPTEVFGSATTLPYGDVETELLESEAGTALFNLNQEAEDLISRWEREETSQKTKKVPADIDFGAAHIYPLQK